MVLSIFGSLILVGAVAFSEWKRREEGGDPPGIG